MRSLSISTTVFALALTLANAHAAVLVSSTFDSGDEGWTSFSFAGGSTPDFSGAFGGAGPVSFVATSGNPAGSIERTDPDNGWQYFVAPPAFLGDQVLALGGALTFQQQRRDDLVLAPATPSALAAFSDGTTLLVYANTASAPVATAWTSYRVSLDASAAGWFVGSTGAAATPEQLQRVLGNLSQLVIAGEWFDGAVSTGQPETIALDNVILSGVDDGTPVPLPGTLALLAAPVLLRLRRGRL